MSWNILLEKKCDCIFVEDNLSAHLCKYCSGTGTIFKKISLEELKILLNQIVDGYQSDGN